MSGSDGPADAPATAQATRADDASILLDLLPHALRTFQREPALALSACYLLVAMAGIFYNYNFYEKFGIPILTLSQISDFLVAGLQEPMALLLVFSTFPMCWIADKINQRKRRSRARWRESLLRDQPDGWLRRARLLWLRSPPRWFTGTMYVVLVIFYGWMFVEMYARHRAAAVKHGDGARVAVWLAGETEPLAPRGAAWTYLGAVSNYVFVYDAAADRAVVLPVNNIRRLEPAAPPASEGTGVPVAPIP